MNPGGGRNDQPAASPTRFSDNISCRRFGQAHPFKSNPENETVRVQYVLGSEPHIIESKKSRRRSVFTLNETAPIRPSLEPEPSRLLGIVTAFQMSQAS